MPGTSDASTRSRGNGRRIHWGGHIDARRRFVQCACRAAVIPRLDGCRGGANRSFRGKRHRALLWMSRSTRRRHGKLSKAGRHRRRLPRATTRCSRAVPRKSPVMQPIAQALSPEQRAQMARYYAKLPSPLNSDGQAHTASGAGAWLASRGRWAEDLPACAQCHGPGGTGVGADFPPLAGQSADYLAAQLKAWQGGERPPGPLGLMEAVARKLKDDDIQAVSMYYAALGRPKVRPQRPRPPGLRSPSGEHIDQNSAPGPRWAVDGGLHAGDPCRRSP